MSQSYRGPYRCTPPDGRNRLYRRPKQDQHSPPRSSQRALEKFPRFRQVPFASIMLAIIILTLCNIRAIQNVTYEQSKSLRVDMSGRLPYGEMMPLLSMFGRNFRSLLPAMGGFVAAMMGMTLMVPAYSDQSELPTFGFERCRTIMNDAARSRC